MIKHLDINHDYPDNNLDLILDKKPEFAYELKKYNKYYFSYVKVLASIYIFNLIISSISIYDHYAGISTITSYMSYTTLILLKLYDSTYISYSSLKNNRALSSYMLEFSSFNVYDKDFLEEFNKQEKINPEKIKLEIDC